MVYGEEFRIHYDHILLFLFFLAAGGYFLFTGYILIHVSTESVKLFGHYGFWTINMLYAGIIIPSAIWIYLTFAMIENPTPLLWIIIRLVLFTVGFSSVALLDAFIWPYYYPK